MVTCLAKHPVFISFPTPLPDGPESTSHNKLLVLESLSQGLLLADAGLPQELALLDSLPEISRSVFCFSLIVLPPTCPGSGER